MSPFLQRVESSSSQASWSNGSAWDPIGGGGEPMERSPTAAPNTRSPINGMLTRCDERGPSGLESAETTTQRIPPDRATHARTSSATGADPATETRRFARAGAGSRIGARWRLAIVEEQESIARITVNPEISGGKPIIRGRCLAVEHVGARARLDMRGYTKSLSGRARHRCDCYGRARSHWYPPSNNRRRAHDLTL